MHTTSASKPSLTNLDKFGLVFPSQEAWFCLIKAWIGHVVSANFSTKIDQKEPCYTRKATHGPILGLGLHMWVQF